MDKGNVSLDMDNFLNELHGRDYFELDEPLATQPDETTVQDALELFVPQAQDEPQTDVTAHEDFEIILQYFKVDNTLSQGRETQKGDGVKMTCLRT